MHQSKVSTVKTQMWQNFSVYKNSAVRAPNFIPIPCPTHTDYSITNICKSPGCIQPLCPQCIHGHVELHQQTKKPAKIQNIINTRIGIIQKLNGIIEQAKTDYHKYQQNSGGNIQLILQKNRKKIEFAKNKINNFFTMFFKEIDQKFQRLEIAYINQKDKKLKQMKAKVAPLMLYIEELDQYKSQLESQDYIPALIQILNEPPKKPPTLSNLQFQNLGEIKIDQYAFESIKTSIQSFVNIKSFLPEQNQFTKHMNQNNSRLSNQMKFSKVGRSSSRQLIQSHLQMSRNQSGSRMQRSNSRKKIFSNQKKEDYGNGENYRTNINSSTYVPISQQKTGDIPKIKILFDSVEKKVSNVDANYFSYDQGILAYFPPYQRHFYAVQALCADRGFQRFQLPQDFTIPVDHQCVITNDSRIFLLGGRIQNKFFSQAYEMVMKLSNRISPSIKNISAMKEARAKFSSICFNSQIYVFGGRKGANLLSSCQRYSIDANKWQSIKSMPQPLMAMNVCSFNQKIIKFGGILQSGQILNRIDIFYPAYNEWICISSQIPFFIKMGSCQINKNEILIFGGQTQFNNKKNQCFVLRQQKSNQMRLSPCINSLYNEGSFENSFVYKNSILAIQNGQDNKNKVIMKFQTGKWRFLSC